MKRQRWLAVLLGLLLCLVLTGCGGTEPEEEPRLVTEDYDLEAATALLEELADEDIWFAAVNETPLQEDQDFVPTYYHEGMTLVSARLERHETEATQAGSAPWQLAELLVRMEYQGDSPDVPQGWYVEYVLKSWDGGQEDWSFAGYRDDEGTSLSEVAYGEDWSVPLQEDFPWDKYPLPTYEVADPAADAEDQG